MLVTGGGGAMADLPRGWDDPDAMIGVDEARARILAACAPTPIVELPLFDALGLVAARDVTANEDVPPFRNSAMDGFAVRAADTQTASRGAPAVLRVDGMVAAGATPGGPLGPGTAVRIMTGAPLPDGADAVVRFEETEFAAGAVCVARPVPPRENVREPGEDVRRGEVVIHAGTALRPVELGVLASLGHPVVAVRRRPRVAILATGNELVEAGGAPLAPGQIRDSNSHTVAAMVRRAGGVPLLLGIARDTTDDLTARLASADAPDLYVTSGGVSVGDYDMVKDVLRARGRIDIWQVRMKPGKPLAFGLLGDVPLLGLPGNPMAAVVSFEQFGRPALRAMLGHANVMLPEVEVTLLETVANPGRRRHFVRGVAWRGPRGYEARPSGEQGAGMLMPLARGNCLIVIPEDVALVEAGQRVQAQLLDHDVL